MFTPSLANSEATGPDVRSLLPRLVERPAMTRENFSLWLYVCYETLTIS